MLSLYHTGTFAVLLLQYCSMCLQPLFVALWTLILEPSRIDDLRCLAAPVTKPIICLLDVSSFRRRGCIPDISVAYSIQW